MIYPDRVYRPSSELVLSHLRDQVCSMTELIATIEGEKSYEEEYVKESIKNIENDIRRLRKYIDYEWLV